MKKLIIILLTTTIFQGLLAQEIVRKSFNASRTTEKISIDAQDLEGSWKTAEIAKDFTQFDPIPDEAPSFDTEVRILYDDEALYVFANLLDAKPDSILKELTLRDNTGNSDWFNVTLDTYQDGQNGFNFAVTSAGVQIDTKYSSDGEDGNWDSVWESKVRIDDTGWKVELRIPFSAFRFSDGEEQIWRIQFGRNIRRFREFSFWNRRDPELDNYVAQCGLIGGLKNIKSPPRISINPFVVGYFNTVKDPEANPIRDRGTAYGLGMDLKYGINDAFTLDMTLIPDFGQTQSDNVELNLGPFEQAFEERRPFFTEGTELFNKGGLFYSRRVGDRTFTSAELEDGESYISNPGTTQLYNAFKISGRTEKGTGIGIFNAVEAREEAVISTANGGQRSEVTNPLTNYNVLVVDQNLPNNSYLSLINTNVFRFGDEYDANVTGIDANLKTKDQKWELGAFGAFSQQFDPEENQSGYAYSLNAAKATGKLTYGAGYNIESDTYDINDLGLLFSNNERSYFANIGFYEYAPKRFYNRWRINANVYHERIFKPNLYSQFEYELNAFFFTKKFLGYGFFTGGQPIDRHDYFEPRTGDFETYSNSPGFQYAGAFISTDYRKTLALDARTVAGNSFYRDERYRFLRIAPRWRVNDQILIQLFCDYELNRNSPRYVNRNGYEEDIPELSDDDILYGLRDRFRWNNVISARYVLTNNSAITLNLRHNHDEVEWHDLGRLNANGLIDPIAFDGVVDDVPVFDQNVNILNMDLQFTKRFAPGSDIIFVWKKIIFGSDQEFERDYFGNLSTLGEHFQSNSVSLRIVYFLDYQTIR